MTKQLHIVTKPSVEITAAEASACDAVFAAYPGHEVRTADFIAEGLDLFALHVDHTLAGFAIYSRQDIPTPFAPHPLPVISLAATYTHPDFQGQGVMSRLVAGVRQHELGLVRAFRHHVCVSAVLSPRLYAFYRRRFRLHPSPGQNASPALHDFARTALALPRGWDVNAHLIIHETDPQNVGRWKVRVSPEDWRRFYASGNPTVDHWFQHQIFKTQADQLWLTTLRQWVVAEYKPWRDWFGRPRRRIH